MAKISFEVIQILRSTASAIAQSPDYQWGHMGACNCGFLAQQITHLRKNEIHDKAMLGHGDWREQLRDYCPTSGLPMDELIQRILDAGFDVDDLKHLERLSDGSILSFLPEEERNLRHNVKADVAKYLAAWAGKIENELLDRMPLPAFVSQQETIL